MWKIVPTDSGYVDIETEHEIIARDVYIDNAPVIAVAPEMLEMLYEACAIFGILEDGNRLPELARSVWAKSREIISKARGE